MKSPPTIIWDWNGTLLDDVDYTIACMNRLLVRRHMPLLERERYRRVFCFPVERYYRQMGFDFHKESFARLSREFIDHYYRGLEVPAPHPGALELVQQLQDAGVVQCILSAMEMDPLRHQLELNGLLKPMRFVQGLNHSHATSKVEEGKVLLRQLNRPGEDVVFIGDTTHDMEVAQALGLQVIIMAHGHQEITGSQYPRHRVCGDFAQLKTVISDIYGLNLDRMSLG